MARPIKLKYCGLIKCIVTCKLNTNYVVNCTWTFISLIYAWMNGWVNDRQAGDLRRHPAYYDAIVMKNDFAT